jgi:hypothetical protein
VEAVAVHLAHEVVGQELDVEVATYERCRVGAGAGRRDGVDGREAGAGSGRSSRHRVHERGAGGVEQPWKWPT